MAESISESYAVLVNALLRHLLCVSPWRAEEGYYCVMVAPPPQPKGWTKVEASGHVGWVFIDQETGTGRYSSTTPSGIDPTLIHTIVIPPHSVFGLRNMVKQMVEQSGAATINPALQDVHGRLISMGNGTFEIAEIARFFDSCRSTANSPATLKKTLEDYRAELLQGMCRTRYPGYYVGLMTLFLKAIAGVEVIVLTGMLNPGGRVPHLMALLKFAFNSILQNDGPGNIEQASANLRAEGKFHLKQADKASRDEVFYGHLFMSCPFFHGAKMGFEYLAATSPPGSDARKGYERKDFECEEFLVYSTSSLLNHFDNLHREWAQFQQHRRRVSELRKSKGDAAAERQVLEYIALIHFYPSYYRNSLANDLPAPLQRDGTSGGAHIGQLCG